MTKFNEPPNDIAYTLQQAKSFGIHHAEMIEMAEAQDVWNDFLSTLDAHKDYCADVGEEPRESE